MIKPPSLTDTEFFRLYTFVRQNFGINLEKKRTLVEARLAFYISQHGYHSFGEYLNTVIPAPRGEECQVMINRLSTNYTFFFRESAALQVTAQKILPSLAAAGLKKVQIWCAACASGEEVYSLAMVLEHTLLVGLGMVDYTIYGTDINTDLLTQAQSGSYDNRQLDSIPAEYQKYVRRRDDHIQISRRLQDKVSWQYENLLETYDAAKWDVIFCRNVMFYFQPDVREKLVGQLYRALRPGGYLVLGSTENVDLKRRLFEHLEPTVYRKPSV